MKKYKLVALFGPSGAGKDYIKKEILKSDCVKDYLNNIIPSTTRPKRDNEIDGVDYHFYNFLSDMTKTKTVELTVFNNWWYCTKYEDLDPSKINIGCFNTDAIRQFLNSDQIDCYPILITANDKTRLLRQLNREENPNCYEICRRYISDYDQYHNINFSHKIFINEEDNLKSIIQDIINIIVDFYLD